MKALRFLLLVLVALLLVGCSNEIPPITPTVQVPTKEIPTPNIKATVQAIVAQELSKARPTEPVPAVSTPDAMPYVPEETVSQDKTIEAAPTNVPQVDQPITADPTAIPVNNPEEVADPTVTPLPVPTPTQRPLCTRFTNIPMIIWGKTLADTVSVWTGDIKLAEDTDFILNYQISVPMCHDGYSLAGQEYELRVNGIRANGGKLILGSRQSIDVMNLPVTPTPVPAGIATSTPIPIATPTPVPNVTTYVIVVATPTPTPPPTATPGPTPTPVFTPIIPPRFYQMYENHNWYWVEPNMNKPRQRLFATVAGYYPIAEFWIEYTSPSGLPVKLLPLERNDGPVRSTFGSHRHYTYFEYIEEAYKRMYGTDPEDGVYTYKNMVVVDVMGNSSGSDNLDNPFCLLDLTWNAPNHHDYSKDSWRLTNEFYQSGGCKLTPDSDYLVHTFVDVPFSYDFNRNYQIFAGHLKSTD